MIAAPSITASSKMAKPADKPASKAAVEKSKKAAANGTSKAKASSAKDTKAESSAKRGTKRAKEFEEEEDELQDDDEAEAKDAAAPLPDVKKRSAKARGASAEPASDVDMADGTARPIKRTRRAPTPAGPINSVPRPIQPVHSDDVAEGIAVEVSTGTAATGGKGAVLPRKLFVWGSGDAGQFGVGPPEDDKPNKLNKPKPFGNKEISMQIDDGDFGEGGIEVIVGGGMHSVMIDSLGRILTSGAEDYGTLGRKHRGAAGDAEEAYFNFAPVEGLSPTGQGINPIDGKEGTVEKYRATRVASADAAGAALDDQGRLRSWGYFKDGEGRVCFADSDGPGRNKEQWYPIALPGIEQEHFAAVAAGENHFLALTLNGRVYSWGTNTCYQLGRSSNPRKVGQKFTNGEPPKDCDLTPTPMSGLAECKRIFCGLTNGFAVEKSGKVVGWGLNTKGQTGTGLKASKIATPHTIAALSPVRHNGAEVVQIVGGNFHTAFLLANGEVYICGDSDEGKLGLPADHPALKGATASNPVVVREPTLVPFPAPPSWAPESAKTKDGKTKIVAISAGMRFTLALAADGTLYSWGTTSDDALGHPAEDAGGDQSKETPTAIAMPGQPGAWRIMAASTAGQHSLAIAVKPPQDD
ncbi:related to GDP/GTP exchange factor for Gsp1p/Gsp2p [Ustilago trichophora]|uniref:Related to GDP/GTP exchange factor for Gsp1p/Gsp2p n=1 Tax=Ustilago trichophora TaxID=86804 RepID=A0A5C3DRZ9_9BASI|nr:related to GDP/GTP exchange factor for Gsp1p/Gsp2p [Ustilago trichophora]